MRDQATLASELTGSKDRDMKIDYISKELIKMRESWEKVSVISMTRLGNLLDFGQVFKAFGKN